MIPVSEMLRPAVWLDWADAYRVCMTIRSNSKLNARAVPSNDCKGYKIILLDREHDNGTGTFVTMGLIAALCARHDLPPDNPKDKQFYGPRFDSFPFFADGLPKERVPNISGPVHSVGVR